jgi:hypothetical protein
MLKYVLDTTTEEYIANPLKHKIKLEQEKLPATFSFFDQDKTDKEKMALHDLGIDTSSLEDDGGNSDTTHEDIAKILNSTTSNEKKLSKPDFSSFASKPTSPAPFTSQPSTYTQPVNYSTPAASTYAAPTTQYTPSTYSTPTYNTNYSYGNYQAPAYKSPYSSYTPKYVPPVYSTTNKTSSKKKTTTKKGGKKK